MRSYVKPEEDVDADDKGPCILQSKVEKAIQEVKVKKVTMKLMYLGMYSDCWGKTVSN